MKVRKDIQLSGEYYLDHVSTCQGYVPYDSEIDECPAYSYEGRYGEGYIVYLPGKRLKSYCLKEYWLRKRN